MRSAAPTQSSRSNRRRADPLVRRKAKELRARLDELLKKAEATFANPTDPHPTFDEQLLEIPGVVTQLMNSIERRDEPRVPFWLCVKALDQDKPKLCVIDRLDKLVSNASKLPSGPFAKLIADFRANALPESHGQLLIELDRYINRAEENLDGYKTDAETRWQPLPSDLTCYTPLLKHSISGTCKALIGEYKPSGDSKSAIKWAYIAFLDLIWQVHDWNKRYFTSVSLFCKLLTELHNSEYDEVGMRLAYAPGKGVADFVEQYKKDKDADRKRQARSQAGAKLRQSTDARDEEDKRRRYLRGTFAQKNRPE